MKALLTGTLFLIFLVATASVFLYLAWGTRRIFRVRYDAGYIDEKIEKIGECICAFYAPICIFLLIAIFV